MSDAKAIVQFQRGMGPLSEAGTPTALRVQHVPDGIQITAMTGTVDPSSISLLLPKQDALLLIKDIAAVLAKS